MSINRNSWLFDQIIGHHGGPVHDDDKTITMDDIIEVFNNRYHIPLGEIDPVILVDMFTYADLDDDRISRNKFSDLLDNPPAGYWKKLQQFADKYETPLVKAMNDGESGEKK